MSQLTIPKIIQMIGLLCISSIFIFQAYEILMDPNKQSEKLFKEYADFRIWSNKAQRQYLGGKTLIEFPSSEFVKPYKLKATYFFAYCNLLGAIGMVIGE